MALPPEYVDRLFGMGQSGYLRGDIDFQARLVLFVHPTLGWINPIGSRPNPVQLTRIRHAVDLYKSFVACSIAQVGFTYHHTPTAFGREPHGWGALELGARDRSRAIAGVFRLSGPVEPEYRLRPRALDFSRRYRVTSDNAGQSAVVDGFTLSTFGIPIRLDSALTSELLFFEVID